MMDALHQPRFIDPAPAEAVRHTRQAVLDQAHQRHPQRITCKPPALIKAVWINPPAQKIAA